MSDEVWAIIGVGAVLFFTMCMLGNSLEKRLDRIINILFDIKVGRRD